MFGFRDLDVYQCAVAFLPRAYALAKLGDGEIASQLRRAALECAAVLDALRTLGMTDPAFDERKMI